MAPIKLGVFANLALAVSAVLIPPTITVDELGDDKAMEGLVMDPSKRLVALDCIGCARAVQQEDSISWEEGRGSALLLDFEVGPHGEALAIDNDFQLYPPVFDLAQTPFYVTQVSAAGDTPLRLRVTGYTFRFDGAETVAEDGTELLPMSLQIASLEGVAVQPSELTINVLKDASGRLMIASLDTAQASEASPVEQECNEWPLLCKWKKIAAERIEKMKKMGKGKGCHKRPHGHHNPMEDDTKQGKPPHRFHPGQPHHRPHHRPHHEGHKGHGHHHPHHRMHMFARRAFFTILIPILIGIFAGTVTYLVGMVLGTFIAIVIAKVRGQGYQRIALEDDVEEGEAEISSEKEAYAELPVYEAPPVYETAPEKEVDESK